MPDRMKTGRLKVAEHLAEWWQEFRLYRRRDYRMVKGQHDLLSATLCPDIDQSCPRSIYDAVFT